MISALKALIVSVQIKGLTAEFALTRMLAKTRMVFIILSEYSCPVYA